MEHDYERAEQKTKELQEAAYRILQQATSGADSLTREASTKQLASDLVAAFITVTPPEQQAAVVLHHVSLFEHGGVGGGTSRKPGNIRLNVERLFLAISKGAFSAVGVSHTPWLVPFAALILWDEYKSCTKALLSENDASVLYAMWMHRDDDDLIQKSDVANKVNHERSRRSQSGLSTSQLRTALANLEQIQCIKPSRKSPDKWWLCEWVSVAYK